MPYLFLVVNFFLTKFTYVNIITSRTPGKAGNTGHGPEYHQPPPVNVPHKYRARQAASLWERESTRRQGRGEAETGRMPRQHSRADRTGRKCEP